MGLGAPLKFERSAIASALDGLLVTPSVVVEAATHICLALHCIAGAVQALRII